MLKPNPRFAEFREALAADARLFTPWRGTLFRFQAVEYPTPGDILSGEGAKKWGGRWNPPGVAAVYGSTSDNVALEESKANDRYYGIVNRKPRLVVAVEADLQRVIDLTQAPVRRRLDLSLRELAAEDWRKLMDSGRETLTQALGRAVFETGGSGLLARSAACRGGVNGVLFPASLQAGERLTVVEEALLKRLTGKD